MWVGGVPVKQEAKDPGTSTRREEEIHVARLPSTVDRVWAACRGELLGLDARNAAPSLNRLYELRMAGLELAGRLVFVFLRGVTLESPGPVRGCSSGILSTS